MSKIKPWNSEQKVYTIFINYCNYQLLHSLLLVSMDYFQYHKEYFLFSCCHYSYKLYKKYNYSCTFFIYSQTGKIVCYPTVQYKDTKKYILYSMVYLFDGLCTKVWFQCTFLKDRVYYRLSENQSLIELVMIFQTIFWNASRPNSKN